MKNLSKIDAKSTLEKVMQKGGKMMPKWIQNEAKIAPKSEK